MKEKLSHGQLVERADKWLKSIGCQVRLKEFVACTNSGEIPDAIGWRSGVSVLVECKASRADFLKDKKKVFRRDEYIHWGMGSWRFYMCEPDVIKPEDLPENWGLLYVHEKIIKRVHGVPKGNSSWYCAPFAKNYNKEAEMSMLLSALRRVYLRGHFDDVYDRLETSSENITIV